MSKGPYPMCVCYGPYHQAGQGPGSVNYSPADIHNDMAEIAKYFKKIRTYSIGDANQWNVDIASQHGLQVCLGAWMDKNDPTVVSSQIDTAIQQANQYPGTVVHLIVGNEVDRVFSDPTPVTNALSYAKQKRGGLNIPVTACFTGTAMAPWSPTNWTNAIQTCEEVVYLTVYPWYGKACPAGNIDQCMQWSYNNGIQQVMAMGKRVIIAEIGWPSSGGSSDYQPTTPENEALNYSTTQSWVSGNNTLNVSFETFWFEMFDEPWKATGPGPWEAFWGLYGSGTAPQPKFPIPS
jgi:exo-beta-1,3-glucanase (GH17 family)